MLGAARRKRRYGEDRHRAQVLFGHVRIHGLRGEAGRHRVHQLQELQRGGDARAAHPPLRQGVPRARILGRRDGPRPGAAFRHKREEPRRDPGRGRRPVQEGLYRPGLPADALQGGRQGPDIPHHDNAGARRQVSRRGLPLHLPQDEHRALRQVLGGGADGDRLVPRRGGPVPGEVHRGFHKAHRGGVRGIRRRQNGDRAPGPRRQHSRGGRCRGDDNRARPRRQGDDLQFHLGFEAEVPRREPHAGAAGRSQGDEEQALRPLVGRREDVRHRLRGVRGRREEAHPVLDLPPGSGEARRGEALHRQGPVGEGQHRVPPRHTVQDPGGEDAGSAGGG